MGNAELWIAGEGPERSALEAKLPPGARLLGFRADVPELLAACDLFVQPSAWEGLPLTVLEAMACGCAVIASDIDAHRDVIGDGATGMIVKRGAKEAWSHAIRDLLANAGRRRQLGVAAAQAAQARFCVKRMVREHADLYRELLNNSLDLRAQPDLGV